MTFTTEYYEAVDLHVRWSDTQDLVLRISPHETIADIKQKIQQSSAVIRNKYIRLIHNGRILHDNTTLSDHNIGKFRLKDAKVQQTSPLPVYIHCSVSEYVPEKRIPVKAKTSALTSSRGFDRLRDSGFSDQDIQLIRTQFHRLQGTLRTQNTRDQAQYLEEQWMEHSETALSDETLQGTYKEMIWGLMLGFFLGIICFFWFRESVFSRRHLMGIAAGIAINISFGVLHVYY